MKSARGKQTNKQINIQLFQTVSAISKVLNFNIDQSVISCTKQQGQYVTGNSSDGRLDK